MTGIGTREPPHTRLLRLTLPTLLLLLAPFCCGFDWGFDPPDKCAEAAKATILLKTLQSQKERDRVEGRVLELCPEGAAGSYVKGLQAERAGDLVQARSDYEAALQTDPAFRLASGNLGLIYLRVGRTDEAAIELSKALQGGSDPRYHRGLAGIFKERKLYPLARYHYEEAVKAYPDDIALVADLGATYAALGLTKQAQASYQRALAVNPRDETALLGTAEVLQRQGQLKEALPYLERARDANPNNKGTHQLLGELYEQLGNMEAADRENALAGLPPKKQPAPVATESNLLRSGDEFFQAKEYPKAIEAYQAALQQRPAWPEALLKLAEAQIAAGNDEGAIASYREAIRHGSSDPSVHYRLGTAYERKGFLDEAIVEYRQVLSRTPDDGDARRRLAEIYTLRGSYQQATEQYHELLKTRKDNPLLYFKLARVHLAAKQGPEAIAAYQESIRLDADNLEAQRELAGLLRKANRLDEAKHHYREVLRLKADEPDARAALIAIYVKEKNYDELVALLKGNIELNPEEPSNYYKLGLVHEFRKEYPEAIGRFQEAINRKADYAKALNALGRVYMKTGRIAEAKESLQAAKVADPDLEETALLLNNIRDELASEPRSYKKSKKGKRGKSAKGAKGKTAKKSAKKSAATTKAKSSTPTKKKTSP